MPAREISTTIKLNGEEKFNAALRDAQREMRVMASDLKAAAAEFEFTGDKQQLLTAKSRTLRDEIAQQDKIVEALTQAVRDSAEKYGDASKQTDGYRIKLSNATTTLFKLKQQLAETDREAEELGRDSVRVGRQIKDGIGDAAEDASESLDDMIKKLSSDVGSLKSSAAFSIATNIATWVTGSIGNISDFVEGTRDYRNKRALAQSAAEQALNLTEEEYNDLFIRIVGITNDADGATEGITTLMKSGVKTYQEALTLVDIMLGLYTQFGEEAKFEDIAESFQETYATGKMVGKLQELAERQGIDPEMVNKAMESAKQEDRVQILANTFAGTGGSQSLQNYRQKNAPLVRENESVAKLEIAKADLAEEAAHITTSVTEIVTDALKTASAVLQLAKGNTEEARKTLEDANSDSTHWLKRVFIPDMSDVKEAGEDISHEAQGFWGNVRESISNLFRLNHPEGEIDETDINRTVENMPELFEEKGAEAGEAYIDGFNDTVENSDVDQALEFMRNRLGDDNLQVEDVFQKNELQKNMTEQLGNVGSDAGAELDKNLNEQMVTAANNANISGANVGTSLKNGMDSTMPLAVASAQSYAAQINAAYASIGAGLNTTVIPSRVSGQPTTGGTGAMTASNTPIILEMSGRELGRAFLPTINTMQGRSLVRTSIT